MKIEVSGEVEENLNALNISHSARNVDEALQILDAGDSEDLDRHPEKRMRAAYLAYEEKRLPELKTEHPTYRLSQLKQLLKKEWQKHPENPLNQRLAAMSK
ncbi:unnamed protein product [Caenorhabditis auriculariae]|uniref:Coiled-coil domain-containing protein n=1 Tax=Caenorhabditis auriculariae TaxID=2777116 RepID=A0A8S1H4J3_9PELO|nr:unnamed protein product [Caenorhabditis auriculariae]